MHSPESVAHEIYLPFIRNKHGDKIILVTIWHKDPCADGTDDSCGSFIRERHVDKEILSKIKKEFEFNVKNNYWFDKNDKQIFSTSGTLIQMYNAAAWIHFKYNRKKYNRFFKNHLHEILSFAENPVDCGGDNITNRWNSPTIEARTKGMAGMIYTDILRKERPWYKHPRWHIHHWSIQIRPLQTLKRRLWDKCSICGKRGFKESAISDWSGKNIRHQKCDQIPPQQLRRNEKLEKLVK